MKRQLFALYLLFLAVAIEANPVTAEQARQKAVQFLQGQVKAGARRRAPSAKQMRMAAKGRADTYYIFNAANPGDGYVVVSGDDATDPILGYSHTGTIDPDNMPCGMRMLLDSYTDQIKFLRANGITREQNKSARKAPARSYHINSTLARYDQWEPYNKMCPRLGVDNLWKHCPTGCEATAMAQLMYYHRWPQRIINTIPSYRTKTNDLEIDAIQSGTAIDWINMLPEYVENEYNSENENAIAELMLMAGASVQMDYKANSSSGKPSFIPYALKKYFGYESADYEYASSYSWDDWLDKLRKEIDNNNPVIYVGYTISYDIETQKETTSGHGFMLEGYDDEGYFDINFGWGGEHNGQFLLNGILMNNIVHYSSNQAAVLNVKPQSVLSPVDIPLKLTTTNILPTNKYVYLRSQSSNQFEDVKLWVSLRNVSPVDSYFDYGLRFVPVDNINHTPKDIILGENMSMHSMGKNGRNGEDITIEGDDYNDGVEYSFTVGSDIPEGTYFVYCISKESGTNVWFENDNGYYIGVVISNDKLAFYVDTVDKALLNLFDLTQTSEAPLRVGQPSEFCYIIENIINTYVDLYDGGIICMAEWKEGNNVKEKPIFIEEMQVPPNGRSSIHGFTFTPTVAGEQDIVFYDKNWQEIGRQTITVAAENESLNMLEMTNLRIDDYDEYRHILDGTLLNGAITLFNHDVVTHSRLVYISFTEVETQKIKERPLIVSIPPNEQITYNFKFSDLKEGNHYELLAKYYLGGEIYHSGPFLCTNDASHDENIAGNEHLRSFEYWFDDDYEHRSTISLNTQKASVRAAIETDHLDDGFHFLHFRVQRDDDSYSGISRSPFLKLTKKEEGYLEYWIDEDEDNKQRLPLDDTEEEQLLTLDLSDNELYPVGFHRLHYQVAVPGSIVGSVQTQAILKLPLGKVTKLEYWFDNNRNAINEISVNGTESGSWLFANNLNLTGLAPGHHRLYYRAKGTDKQLTSAVGMAAIVVNSQFRAEYGDAVLSSFSLSVDGATVVEQGQLNGQKEQEFTYTLDASQLAVGTHTLRASFWNSYGVSVTEQVPFRVSKLGYIKGDVNADGEVDVADAVCIVNHIIGKFVPIFIEPAADVNNDNEIDIADAVCIVNYIIGKIPQFSSYSIFAQPMRSVLPKELLEALPEPQ